MLQRISFTFLFLSFITFISAQSNLSIGEWRSYLPNSNANYYTFGDNRIIAATDSGLILIEDEDLSAQFITKVEGLSGVGLKLVKFDPVRNDIIVVYDNSRIEIVNDEENFPIRDIELNTNIQGAKQINQLHIDEVSKFCYISTSFGIVQYDLENREFGFASFTETEILHTITFGNIVVTSTPEGAYYFDLESNLNPSDFTSWEFLGVDNGLPEAYQSGHLSVINSGIYLVVNNQIFKGNSQLLFDQVQAFDERFEAKDMVEINDGWALTLKLDNDDGEVHFFDLEDDLISIFDFCPNRPNNVVQDSEGRIWISDDWRGMRYIERIGEECKFITFDGPRSSEVSDIQIKDNGIFVASGGVSDAFGYLFSKEGFYFFKENKWENVNENNFSPFAENDIQNAFKILPHPKEDLLYVGSYWAGLVEYNLEDESFQLFDKDNSSLQGAIGDDQRTRISGLAFDRDDNLWIANHTAAKPLSVLTNEGNWFSFDVISPNGLADIVIDQNGFIWAIVSGNSGGVLVYDVGENIQDPNDDRQVFLNNDALPSNQVKSIAVDLDGDVWVGTGDGATVFECGSGVFDQECFGNRPTVVVDGTLENLLMDEVVLSILVDGANRKWLGTRNGLFLQSPDGKNQELSFTTANSPLIDNEILDMAYNDENGEVFIGTAKGIMSYRSNAVTGGRRHSNNVYAYPNPVEPNYTGVIAIKGLARDAEVKITSLNGELVFETTALGGQAIWDGNLFNGSRAAAGVYLVFSSSSETFDDPDSFVTKILLLR